jgi:hypothetical protein
LRRRSSSSPASHLQPQLMRLSGRGRAGVHSYHTLTTHTPQTERRIFSSSPQVADLRPALHRRGCWSLPPDRDTLLHLSTPHLVSHTDAPDTRSSLYGCLHGPVRGGPKNSQLRQFRYQKHAPLQRTAPCLAASLGIHRRTAYPHREAYPSWGWWHTHTKDTSAPSASRPLCLYQLLPHVQR